ncbi:MAG TPA: RHS repeat-associated core domain-containing protein [Gemmatimonadaceae bacterium]|nr:RHS repeat-associated core domain-containing protein [Gemmatimonadaceae bacterium]
MFQYDANGKLAVALAPTVGGVARNDTVTIVSGLLNKIKGPDTTSVSFSYVSNDTNMIATRTDRVGTVATYTYGVARKLKSFSVDPGFSQTVITLNFSPFETASLSLAGSTRIHALIADSAFTLLDGARRDTSLFWPDRLGEPNRVRNALGYVTMVRRAAGFPGLAAWSRDAKGRVQSATYDAHGNPLVVVDSSTFDPVRSKYAVTTYTWDLLWDFMKRVKLPEDNGQLRSYSSVTGNLLWQQPDSDSTVTTRRTVFAYNASGAAKNLLLTVKTPGSSHPDSLAYDNLGNANASWTGLGFKSRSVLDDIGRATSTVAPINATDSLTTTATLNLVNEDLETRSVGKTTGSAWTDTLVVTKTFDREGRPLDVTRRAAPDRAALTTLVTRYRYDKVGRKIKEISPNAANDTLGALSLDTWVYDAAGNDTAHTTRRGYTLRTSYDVIGRVSQRVTPAVMSDSLVVQYNTNYADARWQFPRYKLAGTQHLLIPQDVATFTYDAIGAILTANNNDAHITRTYQTNGQLATEESDVRTWLDVGSGGNFSSHSYRDSVAYDLDGRRRFLRVPTNIAPTAYGSSTPLSDITYSYDAITGQLADVHDMMGSDFRMFYTPAGQIDSVGYPGAIGEKFHYDGQHRLSSRLERGPIAFWPSGLLHQDSMSYDMRDQLARVYTFADSTTNQYSLLGHLTQTRFGTSLSDSLYFGDWTNDALGNRLTYTYRSTPADFEHPPQTFVRSYRYEARTGRLWKDSTANSPYDYYEQFGGNNTHLDSSAYEPNGNQRLHVVTPRVSWADNAGWGRNISYSYYGADDKLRAFDQRRCVGKDLVDPPCKPPVEVDPSTAGAYEDYRYDALGRRVLVRSRLDTVSAPAPNFTGCRNPSGLCHSVIERYVWDGDQILMEMRMPGGDTISTINLERDTTTIIDKFAAYGRVTYVHGGVLDHPFAIIRNGYTYDTSSTLKSWAGATEVIPHQSWRNKDDLGNYTDGRAVSTAAFGGDTTGGHCRKAGTPIVCMTIAWPEQYAGMFGNPSTGFIQQHWFGSLAQEKIDGSGQIYMRNRYYDGSTGRFTQEDPIGLAGGLNAYGFANGNPVGYDDPFGLWSFSLQGCSHGFAGICVNITVGRENGQTLVKVKAGVGVGGGVEFHPTDHIAGDGREAKGGAAHVGFVAGAGVGLAHAGANIEYHEGNTFYFHPEGGADIERVEGTEKSASLTSEGSLSAKASGIAGADLEFLTPTPKDGNDTPAQANP